MLRFIARLLTPRYRPKKKPSKKVAIMVPVSDRHTLTADERVSLQHLFRHLGPYDKYLIAPRGSRIAIDGFRVLYFPKKFFGSLATHNRLVFAPRFYHAFADYEFMLTYHFDCLVFSDQLLQWCDAGVDFIGPPWLKCEDSPWVDRPRVGNGGFSLLRIERALQVLYKRYEEKPDIYWIELFMQNGQYFRPIMNLLSKVATYWPHSRLLNRLLLEWDASENPAAYGRNNDVFWSDHAVRYVPEFKVATLEQGLRFGFEAAPRQCFELAGRKLPFGCHAWARYDRKFWEPYLLTNADDAAGDSVEPAPVSEDEAERPLKLAADTRDAQIAD
jgi:hypothetical protein